MVQEKIHQDLVCSFLKRKGYEIVKVNWSCDFGKIDIIACIDSILVFIKVQNNSDIFNDFCNYKELSKIYLRDANFHNMDVRFDVVSVYEKFNSIILKHNVDF